MVRLLILALALWVGSGAELASKDPAPATQAKTWHFLAPSRIDATKVLPPPPAPGSLVSQADVEAVRMCQAWRSPEQVAWAQSVDRDDPFASTDILGDWFKAENLPRCAKLLQQAGDDANAICWKAKALFQRTRPYDVDPRIQPCVPRQTNSSYPSGHSFNVFIRAQVLAEIFPDQREALVERAHRAAWGRIIGGVHFPSDDVAGRLLAQAVMATMLKEPAFQAAVQACREEAELLRSRR